MTGAIGSLLALLALAPDADVDALASRARDLRLLYEELASNQDVASRRKRRTVVRELGHLPWRGAPRNAAGKLLARIVVGDRSYAVRAEAARAIGAVGTAPALSALYRALFGADVRQGGFPHLDAVLPDAIARLHRADDLGWISRHILQPAVTREWTAVLRAAGPLRYRAIAATLRGLSRAECGPIVPEILTLTRAPRPSVRVAAFTALGGLGQWDPVFEKAAEDERGDVRAAVATNPRLPLYLNDRLARDKLLTVRRAAAQSLARRAQKDAVPRLIERLGTEADEVLGLEMVDLLAKLTGKDFGGDVVLWRQWWQAQGSPAAGGNAQAPPVPKKGAKPAGDQRAYFFGVGFRTRRVLFLIDVSGSMARKNARGRSRLQRAAAELGRTLKGLDSRARFRVLAFSSSLQAYPAKTNPDAWTAPMFGNRAIAWLSRLKPAGATNTYGALMAAFESKFQPDTIVVLSDGRPYRCSWKGKNYQHAEQILAEVRRVNATRAVRIHTVALLDGPGVPDKTEDEDAAADFLRRLAADNRGSFREMR